MIKRKKIWDRTFSEDRNHIILSYNGLRDLQIQCFFHWNKDRAVNVKVNGIELKPTPKIKTFNEFKHWVGDNIERLDKYIT